MKALRWERMAPASARRVLQTLLPLPVLLDAV